LTDKAKEIDEAASLAVLKLLIFETAAAYLKQRGIEPDTDTLRKITQMINIESLRKLHSLGPDKASFEAETERIVAKVLYEYGQSTNTVV